MVKFLLQQAKVPVQWELPSAQRAWKTAWWYHASWLALARHSTKNSKMFCYISIFNLLGEKYCFYFGQHSCQHADVNFFLPDYDACVASWRLCWPLCQWSWLHQLGSSLVWGLLHSKPQIGELSSRIKNIEVQAKKGWPDNRYFGQSWMGCVDTHPTLPWGLRRVKVH